MLLASTSAPQKATVKRCGLQRTSQSWKQTKLQGSSSDSTASSRANSGYSKKKSPRQLAVHQTKSHWWKWAIHGDWVKQIGKQMTQFFQENCDHKVWSTTWALQLVQHVKGAQQEQNGPRLWFFSNFAPGSSQLQKLCQSSMASSSFTSRSVGSDVWDQAMIARRLISCNRRVVWPPLSLSPRILNLQHHIKQGWAPALSYHALSLMVPWQLSATTISSSAILRVSAPASFEATIFRHLGQKSSSSLPGHPRTFQTWAAVWSKQCDVQVSCQLTHLTWITWKLPIICHVLMYCFLHLLHLHT